MFDEVTFSPTEIESAGEKAHVVVYNGKKNDTLNNLLMAKYCEKISKSLNKVEPRSLPPTSGAAKYHSYRVFLQVQQWKSIDCSLQAEVWGWNLLDTGYFPRSTDLPPAPGELLKNIRCNCATDLDDAAAKSMV